MIIHHLRIIQENLEKNPANVYLTQKKKEKEIKRTFMIIDEPLPMTLIGFHKSHARITIEFLSKCGIEFKIAINFTTKLDC